MSEPVTESAFFVGDLNELAEFFRVFGSWLRDSSPDVFEATCGCALPEPGAHDTIDTLESPAQRAAVLDEFAAQSDTYPLNG